MSSLRAFIPVFVEVVGMIEELVGKIKVLEDKTLKSQVKIKQKHNGNLQVAFIMLNSLIYLIIFALFSGTSYRNPDDAYCD